MSNRLSHSSVKLYSECGKKYELHYQKRLREATKSGALLFGTAIDKATESVLKNPEVNEYEVFDKSFTEQDINGHMVHLPDSLLCVYAASDFDPDLLNSEDLKFLSAKIIEMGLLEINPVDLYERCKSAKAQKAYRTFSIKEHKYYNLCNWMSLRRKGHLMLVANREKVLPLITKVIGTQVEINLANDEGDSVIGYADVVCKWKGYTEDLVMDYKTSARAYEENAVLVSAQLALYGKALGIKRAGFIVFKKQVLKNRTKICSACSHTGTGSRASTCDNEVNGKRCKGAWIEKITPEIDVQIIIDRIPERTTEIISENIEMVNRGVRAGIFTRNLDNCVKPYGRCAYYNLCHNDDIGDLVQMPEKEEKKN